MDEKETRKNLETPAEDGAARHEKAEQSLSDSASSSAASANGDSRGSPAVQPRAPHHSHCQPEIDPIEAESAVPGHALDIELAQVSGPRPRPRAKRAA